MPCSQRKARILLKQKKAKIVSYKPFTIQLNYSTGESVQPVHIGIDEGTRYVGFAVTSQGKVFIKGTIELRQDIKSLIFKRRQLRSVRRYRKTRYRKAKYLNRKQDKFCPSVKAKLNAIFFWIEKIKRLLPNYILHIEVAKFDIAKMINPNTDYLHGPCYDFDEIKDYVLERDKYTCQICKKSNVSLCVHHIVYKNNGGTDRADNLITLCKVCHSSENHKSGILQKWQQEHKKFKQYIAPTFMNIIRSETIRHYPNTIITYGHRTKKQRELLNLSKTHYNDAIAISGIEMIKENTKDNLYIKQFRKKKRSLHEAIPRKGINLPNSTQKRNCKNVVKRGNFCFNDEVICLNQQGWISGFSNSSIYVKNIKGEYLSTGKSSIKLSKKLLNFKCHNNNWQFQILSD